MNYYYDLLINLKEDSPLEFYEWLDTDPVEYIKKVPIFRVKSKVIKDLHKYEVKFEKEIIDKIYQKTELKDDILIEEVDYMMLLTDTKSSIIVELDNKGTVIGASKLLLSDELNILEIAYAFTEQTMDYEKLKEYSSSKELRIEREIKKFLLCELNTLIQNKDIKKLQYLYFEWSGETLEDIATIKQNLKKLIESPFTEKHQDIYNIVRLSYQTKK